MLRYLLRCWKKKENNYLEKGNNQYLLNSDWALKVKKLSVHPPPLAVSTTLGSRCEVGMMSRYGSLVAVVPTFPFFTVAETKKSSKTHRLEPSSVHTEPGYCRIDDMLLLIDHSQWPFSLYIATTGINLTCTERTSRKCYSTNNILSFFRVIANNGFFLNVLLPEKSKR